MARGRRRRRRYYVNTNFFIDLEHGLKAAVMFARRYMGELCTSKILIYEYHAVGKQHIARRLAAAYKIYIYRVNVLKLMREARRTLLEMGVLSPSDNTVIDTAHILAARYKGIKYFVTSDKRTCKRAIRLGLYCINHRTGEEYAP